MAAEETKDEVLKVTEQADGTVVVGDVAPTPPSKEGPQDDERVTKSEEDDGTHEEEAGHAEETAEEAEARKQRNRERRAQNKERRKEYVEQLRREISARDEALEQALQRIEAIEKQGQGSQLAALDQELRKTADAYNYFKTQIDLGTREQNGAVVADATEKMLQAQQRFAQLTSAKNNATRQAQAAPPLDPRLKANAESWLARNTWYSLEGKDEDSFLVQSIDRRMAQEGWNPSTEAYWSELDARVKKYLPHRASSSYNKPTQTTPRTPVAGSGRDSGAVKPSGGYTLSAERVSALKDAGIWDDPKARADAIRRYQAYDKEQA